MSEEATPEGAGAQAPDEEVKVDSSTTQTETTPPESEQEDAKQTKPKEPSRSQKRIGELTSEKYAYKRQLDDALEKISQLEAKTALEAPNKPRFMDYESDDAYEAAMDEYYSAKAEYEKSQENQQASQQAQMQQQTQERNQSAQLFAQKCREQETHFEDFWTAISEPTFCALLNNMNQDIVSLIQGLENGPGVLYHLSHHLDEAEKIVSLPPANAAFEVAKLSSSIKMPTAKTVSSAPEPTTVPSGSATNQKNWDSPEDRDSMSIDEWMAHRNKTKKVM